MPEGDTIRRLAESIRAKFRGDTIRSSRFRHPQYATLDLTGATLQQTAAHGKHLFLRLSNGLTIHIHLRLHGSVHLWQPRKIASFRRKMELEFAGGWLVAADVPVMDVLKSRDEKRVIEHLGPSVCGVYDHSAGIARFAAAGDLPIAQAMLDQTIVAGFGNIYAVETPFLVGINPHTPVGVLSDVAGLLSIAVGLIRTNAKFGPQNTTGQQLHRSCHWVLSNQTRHCSICGTKVLRIRGSDCVWKRRTAWCVSCQKASHVHVDLQRAAKLLRMHPCRKIVDIVSGKLTAATDRPVECQSLPGSEAGRQEMR